MFFGALHFNGGLEKDVPHHGHQSFVIVIKLGSNFFTVTNNTITSLLMHKYSREPLRMSLR